MSDLIDRQDVLDAFLRSSDYLDKDMIIRTFIGLSRLPSAQPEIIHCEDCAKCQIDNIYHDYWCNGQKVWKTHYCGYAERRTDGSD